MGELDAFLHLYMRYREGGREKHELISLNPAHLPFFLPLLARSTILQSSSAPTLLRLDSLLLSSCE